MCYIRLLSMSKGVVKQSIFFLLISRIRSSLRFFILSSFVFIDSSGLDKSEFSFVLSLSSLCLLDLKEIFGLLMRGVSQGVLKTCIFFKLDFVREPFKVVYRVYLILLELHSTGVLAFLRLGEKTMIFLLGVFLKTTSDLLQTGVYFCPIFFSSLI